MSQYNELEQALKVADNPALCSTPERILAAEVRRLQAVNQTINAIWEDVDAYARNHSEIQLGESVSQHALELMRERDELKAELARLREQTAVAQVEVAHGFHKRTTNWLKALPDGTHLLFTGPVAAPAGSNVYVVPIPAPESNPVQWLEDEGDNILVPRGLLGAACSAIRNKRPGDKVVAALRHYTQSAAPAVPDDRVSQDDAALMQAASALALYRAGESAEYMAKAIEALLQSSGDPK